MHIATSFVIGPNPATAILVIEFSSGVCKESSKFLFYVLFFFLGKESSDLQSGCKAFLGSIASFQFIKFRVLEYGLWTECTPDAFNSMPF